MRKIYPPFFIKFAVFVLYILSITVVTLAQGGNSNSNGNETSLGEPQGCQLTTIASPIKPLTIGYYKLFPQTNPPNPPNQPNPLGPPPSQSIPSSQPNQLIDPKAIRWDYYDFINVIAYPGQNGSPWNSIYPPSSGRLSQIDDLVKAKNSGTKILLSIRNYDTSTWPSDSPGRQYDFLVNQTITSINNYNLDGVDIEYPGMRGTYCNTWDNSRDNGFIIFINRLRNQMSNKTLMITVGSNAISTTTNEQDQNLANLINFLNIETYHYSFYENLRNHLTDSFISSYSNAPLYEFDSAYKTWKQIGFNDSSKIIMGVDFGNTLQAVPATITQNVPNETVEFNPNSLQPLPNISSFNQINGLCSSSLIDSKLKLYFYPWNLLISNSILSPPNYCDTNGWVRQFDTSSRTPWLYLQIPGSGTYQYISYEDIISLSKKLDYLANNSIRGMSISDISYDDGNDTLLNYIRNQNQSTSHAGNSPGKPGNGNGSAPLNPNGTNAGTNSTDSTAKTANTGAIVGGVIGSVVCLGLLGAASLLYRKKYPKSPTLRDIPPKSSHGTHQVKEAEISTEPPQNRFGPAPTTVIPIASGYVTAMFDFNGKEENDLSFKKGDKIEILERGDGPNDWWVGRVNGAVGEFPGNYVKET